MQITAPDEQRMMLEMLDRFLDDRDSATGADASASQDWRQLGELGVLAFALPEAAGGFAGGRPGIAAIAEEFGRALAFTPYAAEGFIAAAAALGVDRTRAELLSAALAGEGGLSFVSGPPGRPIVGKRDGGKLRLSGGVTLVLPDDPSVRVVLHVEIEGSQRLYLVPASHLSSDHDARMLVDGTGARIVDGGGLELSEAEEMRVEPEQAAALLADHYVAKTAELVGCMHRAFEDTLRHTSERRQFGQSISGFQAVRHKLARMFVAVEQAKSMLLRASFPCDEVLASAQAPLDAFVFAASSSLPLVQEAVQLHGGMGVTREIAVSRAHRRILRLSRSEGAPEELRYVIDT